MPTRRIVTAINEDGKSYVLLDGPTPGHVEIGPIVFDELWTTDSSPPELAGAGDPADVDRAVLEPPAGGVKWRVVTFPPEGALDMAALSPEALAEIAERYDGGDAHDDPDDIAWHRTDSIDFGVVLSGEIDLELDAGEVHLTAGDCVVQRGTRHAWRNRGSEPCMVSFVLVSATG